MDFQIIYNDHVKSFDLTSLYKDLRPFGDFYKEGMHGFF